MVRFLSASRAFRGHGTGGNGVTLHGRSRSGRRLLLAHSPSCFLIHWPVAILGDRIFVSYQGPPVPGLVAGHQKHRLAFRSKTNGIRSGWRSASVWVHELRSVDPYVIHAGQDCVAALPPEMMRMAGRISPPRRAVSIMSAISSSPMGSRWP